mgnify:CR=1 FL=1
MNTQAQIEVAAAPLRAQADGGGAGGIFGSPIFFLVAMLLLMWALLIRPQQRKDKEHKAMLSQVEKGDAVITTGGLHGRDQVVPVLHVDVGALDVTVKLYEALGVDHDDGDGLGLRSLLEQL